jgi:hypothetical protein
MDRESKKLHVLVLLVIAAWELLGIISSTSAQLFSRPSKIILVYFTSDFVSAAGNLIFIPILSFVPGILIGIATGRVIALSQTVTQFGIKFLDAAIWMPFFACWTLPFWPTFEAYWTGPFVWLLAASIVAVASHSCHSYLTAQTTAKIDLAVARREMLFRAIRVAVLFSICAQFWFLGWFWRLAIQNWRGFNPHCNIDFCIWIAVRPRKADSLKYCGSRLLWALCF